MFKTGQSANIRYIAFADNADAVITSTLDLREIFPHTLAGFAIKGKRPLNIIHCKTGTQGNTIGRDDITQFFALGTLDLNIAFCDQSFEMPINRSHRDGGMSWETISPDLTTNDKTKQEASGGPINNDITGVEISNVIFALSEDPNDARTLWAGSDDGRIHITRDGGTTWQNITPPNMPVYGTVENIDLSAHRAGRAYVAVQKFRMDDFRPYVYRTEDYGRTWTLSIEGIPAGSPVRSVREDPVKDGVAYAGPNMDST